MARRIVVVIRGIFLVCSDESIVGYRGYVEPQLITQWLAAKK